MALGVADPRARCESTSSSSVSRQAASSGSAAFLLPAAAISPESGAPPWITNFSIPRARVTRRMARSQSAAGRSLIGLVVACSRCCSALINAVIVDQQTKAAEVNVEGGEIVSTSGR